MSTKETTPDKTLAPAPSPSASHLQSNVNKVLSSPKVPAAAHDNSIQQPQAQPQKQNPLVSQNLPCRDLLLPDVDQGNSYPSSNYSPCPSPTSRLRSVVEQKILNRNILSAHNNSIQQPQSHDNMNVRVTPQPNLPCQDLLTGSREDYLKIGVPLYEASIKCDWKAAKAILKEKPELVRYSITEKGETALHVAASAKGSKHVEEFLKSLVDLMNPEDLALENEYFNTALYLAAAAGNVGTVKIMLKKNRHLLRIPGAGQHMLPLYAAALFGHYDVVKYLFKMSNNLCDEDGWNDTNRGWLVEKCVENDMFDVALQIVESYPRVGKENVLRILAAKPEAFPGTKSNIFGRTIKPVLTFIHSKLGNREKENKALPLLKAVWNDIVKLPKINIDRILRGPPDFIKEDKSLAYGRVVQAIQLQNLIIEHVEKMLAISENTIEGSEYTKPYYRDEIRRAQQLENLISAQLVSMHVDIQNIMKGAPESLALELQELIGEHMVDLNKNTDWIIRTTAKEFQAPSLQKAIYEHASKMDKERQRIIKKPAKDTYSSRLLFVAAEMGNTTFVVELIRLHPDLIWKVNDDNQTIFHIAVKHRHESIYNLLYEIGPMKDLITNLRDSNDNNMLHLVGISAKDLDDASGVALWMQRELLWFQEVKQMIPPYLRERKNKDGLTPHELFTTKHKDLVTQSGQWMKDTASQCMVVAALIATIVFAAAFTIPGGYDGDSGLPTFQSKATLIVFVVADAISLFSSSVSILIFLAILTSRYAERDFLESLPKKLMFGLATLFLSIATMTIVFAVSFFVLYHKGLLWIPILIGVIAVIPVLLYVKLQYSLFIDVIRASYGSKYIFKPTKHVLYYENPKV